MKKKNLRANIRNLAKGEQISMPYNPDKMTLSSIRVTASNLGVDTGNKYSVNKQDKLVIISRLK